MIVKGSKRQWAEGLLGLHTLLPHRGKRQLLISASRSSQAEHNFPICIYIHGMDKARNKWINKDRRPVPL